jgi:hypothetical protein
MVSKDTNPERQDFAEVIPTHRPKDMREKER